MCGAADRKPSNEPFRKQEAETGFALKSLAKNIENTPGKKSVIVDDHLASYAGFWLYLIEFIGILHDINEVAEHRPWEFPCCTHPIGSIPLSVRNHLASVGLAVDERTP